jgi:hypothetical protein
MVGDIKLTYICTKELKKYILCSIKQQSIAVHSLHVDQRSKVFRTIRTGHNKDKLN